MVFITGDCHGDFRKFSTKAFPQQRDLTIEDTVIVCGDFGLWHDGPSEQYWLKWLNDKPFTTVFVDGNHENFDRLYSKEFEVVDFHGGKAHKIREHIYHLMRGYVFDFDGKSFFCFGGASSHDISDGILDLKDFDDPHEFYQTVKAWYGLGKMFRVNHSSWWAQEMPSDDELAFGLQSIIRHGNNVDYIISHCCPQEVASFMGFHSPDRLTQWFNMIAHTVSFNKWYFGHYHTEQSIWGKFVCLYDKIERIV